MPCHTACGRAVAIQRVGAGRVFSEQREPISIAIRIGSVREGAVVILLKAIVDTIRVAVGGKQMRHRATIDAIHYERKVTQGDAPSILLPHTIQLPIAEIGLRHVWCGDRGAVGHDRAHIDAAGRQAAECITGEARQVDGDHRRVGPCHATLLMRVRVERISATSKFGQQRDAVAVRIRIAIVG